MVLCPVTGLTLSLRDWFRTSRRTLMEFPRAFLTTEFNRRECPLRQFFMTIQTELDNAIRM